MMSNLEFLEALAKFRLEAGPREFERIFGDVIGPHLWRKYSELYHFDLLQLIANLDIHKKALLVHAISGGK